MGLGVMIDFLHGERVQTPSRGFYDHGGPCEL
jgi:hypothetical protein